MLKIALYQIHVGHGGRLFDMSQEMFVWLHLINPVTVDCTGAGNFQGHAVLAEIVNSPTSK